MRFTLLCCFTILSAITGSSQTQLRDWKINETESYVIFIAKNLGLSVTGKISGMTVSGYYNEENVTESRLTGSIDVATLDTKIELRDNHLKSSDYFDAKKYPKITYTITSIQAEAGTLIATGDLTIKGVVRKEKIKFTVERKGESRVFTGDITIQRKDYELGSNSTLVMADTIRVRVFVVFEKRA